MRGRWWRRLGRSRGDLGEVRPPIPPWKVQFVLIVLAVVMGCSVGGGCCDGSGGDDGGGDRIGDEVVAAAAVAATVGWCV